MGKRNLLFVAFVVAIVLAGVFLLITAGALSESASFKALFH